MKSLQHRQCTAVQPSDVIGQVLSVPWFRNRGKHALPATTVQPKDLT